MSKSFSMTELFRSSKSSFGEWIGKKGFITIAPGIFLRPREDIFDAILFQRSLHGPMFRVFAYHWVPEFCLLQKRQLSLARSVCLTWAKPLTLGPYTSSHSKWWSVVNRQQAESFFRDIQAPMTRGFFPMLEVVPDKRALMNNLLPQTPPEIKKLLESGFTHEQPEEKFVRKTYETLSTLFSRTSSNEQPRSL